MNVFPSGVPLANYVGVSIVKIYSPGYRIISCTLEMVCPKSCHNQVENVSFLSNAWALFRRVVGVWDGRVMQLTHNSQAGTEASSQKFKATAAHEFWGSITVKDQTSPGALNFAHFGQFLVKFSSVP
jgi:hypothetical protein